MRIAFLVLILSVVAWAITHGTLVSESGGKPPPFSSGKSCNIAGLPDGQVPELTLAPIAELLPEQMPKLEKAYFSMGCFWGSEAMLASCPGVVFTRAGFTGGTLPNPSYSAIGDHVETVEVLFDPERITYEQLLDHFWSHHNARAKPIFRQYASAIFTVGEQQEKQAKAVRAQRQATRSDDPLLTAVRPLASFFAADVGHQKYYLSQDPDLLKKLPRDATQRLDTRIATKLNAVVGRAGNRASLKDQLVELGLTQEMSEALLARAAWPREEHTSPP